MHHEYIYIYIYSHAGYLETICQSLHLPTSQQKKAELEVQEYLGKLWDKKLKKKGKKLKKKPITIIN